MADTLLDAVCDYSTDISSAQQEELRQHVALHALPVLDFSRPYNDISLSHRSRLASLDNLQPVELAAIMINAIERLETFVQTATLASDEDVRKLNQQISHVGELCQQCQWLERHDPLINQLNRLSLMMSGEWLKQKTQLEAKMQNPEREPFAKATVDPHILYFAAITNISTPALSSNDDSGVRVAA